MKRLVYIVLGCLLSLTPLLAARQTEGTIKGLVKDAAGAPLEFATVYLTGTDGTIVTGSSSDEAGQFTLKAVPGEYVLGVSL